MDVEEFIEQFRLLMDRSKSTTQYAHLRSTISSEKEANKFVELFAEKTNTNWTPQKQYSLKYVFYCTWFCNPFWRKQVLPEEEDYNPFFRKKDTSQGGDCSAKIDVYIRKPDASSAVCDEYLYYDPPLPCVIEIAGQHNHPLEHPEDKATKGIDDKLRSLVKDDSVKREFFKYFQMGLSVSDAKKKYTMHYRQKKPPKKITVLIPTMRQAEILYKEWENVKDCFNLTLKEGNCRKINPKAVSFKEFLEAVPKREIMHSVKHLESETNKTVKSDENAQNKDIKFPLVFASVGSAAGMPSCKASLLYKLKHNIGSELVSDLVRPRIYSVYIESENSSEPVSNEILGIPTSADESRVSVEAAPKYALDIPIKLEPLNDGYEDISTQGSTEMMEDTSILPTPTQAFSSGDTTSEEIDIKPNISSKDATSTEEIDTKPNIWKAGNSFLPLMFTLKGSVYETSNGRSLVYDLKQGSTGVQATDAVMPQISSVRINSLNEAAFQFKDASMLTVEGPLSVTIQTELLEVNSNTASSNDDVNERVDDEDMPVIINASSCSDLLPVITDYDELCSLKEQEIISDPENVKKPVLNLAPSDFHLFLKLKEFLGGKRFGSDEELENAVTTWLNELEAEEGHGNSEARGQIRLMFKCRR
ncbi:hypothetical protein AVEN_24948-1 [Araneus ventricosus]|uniref:Uncharacterized protein n=1 Tax=Araneus ventricosus TaxID=182803 RepID=A0A4Y2G4X6_ARAVE|nr:hypothetical protein AVEN_24948-1 [Araneus ventricosus]